MTTRTANDNFPYKRQRRGQSPFPPPVSRPAEDSHFAVDLGQAERISLAAELQPLLKETTSDPYQGLPASVLEAITTKRQGEKHQPLDQDEWRESHRDCREIFGVPRMNRESTLFVGALYGLQIHRRDTAHAPLCVMARLYHQSMGRIPPRLLGLLEREDLQYLVKRLGLKKELKRIDLNIECLPAALLPCLLANPAHFFVRISPALIKRVQEIAKSPFRHSILQHYDGEIRMIPSQVETLYLELGRKTAMEMIEGLGIVLPQGKDPAGYLIDNIPSYNSLRREITQADFLLHGLMNGINIAILRDDVIIDALDIELEYRSREELESTAMEAVRTGCHFFFPIYRRHRLNSETMLGTPTSDLSILMVGYGSLTHYRLYEEGELWSAWRSKRDRRIFIHPEDSEQLFTTNEVDQLLRLVRGRWNGEFVEFAHNSLITVDEMITGDEERIETIQALSPSEQALVRELLYAVFEAGMYMRRWKGPPHPYPLSSSSTLGPTIPQETTEIALIRIRTIMDKMTRETRNVILSLAMVERRRGESFIRIRYDDFAELWRDIICGERGQCIRLASSVLVSSAWHYLFVFFGETIPNFDRFQVDHVM